MQCWRGEAPRRVESTAGLSSNTSWWSGERLKPSLKPCLLIKTGESVVSGHSPPFTGSGLHLSHPRVPLTAAGNIPECDISQEISSVPGSVHREQASPPHVFLRTLPASSWDEWQRSRGHPLGSGETWLLSAFQKGP